MIRSFFVTMGIAAGALLTACEVAPTDSSSEEATSAERALGAVQNCLQQQLTCKGDPLTSPSACEQELQSCLGNLVPNAGAIVSVDGGVSIMVDADLPPIVPPGPLDAGSIVPRSDAARAPVLACLQDARMCLAGATDALTCLENARACLRDVVAMDRHGGLL